MRDHLDVGVERVDGDPCRLDFRHADAIVAVQDLPLQVREIDDVVIDDAERADPGGGEIQGRR